MADLYPFLFPQHDTTGSRQPAAQATRISAREKAEEIVALRARTAARIGSDLTACATAMAGDFRHGGRLLCFGNGGSSTDAQALAALFREPGADWPRLPAMSLTASPAVLSALANDIGIAVVFARQIAAHGQSGDIALGLSTSGNSENVLAGFAEAHRRGLRTVAFAGYDGGQLAQEPARETVDHLFVIESTSVHRVQEAQTTAYQVLWELVAAALTDRRAGSTG
jgi:D-sedoheptulose 7-phosphate isomerase